MLNLEQAHKVVLVNLPGCSIDGAIEYNGRYIFIAYTDRGDETGYDPFYSVDAETGKFGEFSIITGGDIGEIFALFEQAKQRKEQNNT